MLPNDQAMTTKKILGKKYTAYDARNAENSKRQRPGANEFANAERLKVISFNIPKTQRGAQYVMWSFINRLFTNKKNNTATS